MKLVLNQHNPTFDMFKLIKFSPKILGKTPFLMKTLVKQIQIKNLFSSFHIFWKALTISWLISKFCLLFYFSSNFKILSIF
jgi:hypothetical protein